MYSIQCTVYTYTPGYTPVVLKVTRIEPIGIIMYKSILEDVYDLV